MKKQLYSLRTTLSLAFGLMLLIAIALTSWFSIRMARDAYLKEAIRDIEYIADQLVADVDPIAANSASEADFRTKAGPVLRQIGEQYFAKNGMGGYAGANTVDGVILFHPKVESGNLKESEWGKGYLTEAAKAGYNGTIFYDWQNPGEQQPRAKFGVLRRLSSKPDWHIAITAYTEDDLLLPFRTVQNSLIALGAGILLVSVLLAVLFAQSLTLFVRRLQGVIARVAEGDLRTDHEDMALLVKRKDELGDMARLLHGTVGSLRTIVHGVTTGTNAMLAASASMTASSDAVSAAARGAADGAGQVARGASEQAASSEEVGRTMAEFHQTISQIAMGASDSASEVQQASQLLTRVVADMEAMADRSAAFAAGADHSARSAQRGAEVVGGTVSGMERIRHSVGDAARELHDLSDLSTQINAITEVISEIAAQTSMLALNAAIEAARAGEHGRGFAVVAEEVRRLADRSATSARTITDLISRIQQQTARAVAAMESGTAEVDQGTRLAADAGQALAQILEVAHASARDMQGITALTEQVRSSTRGVVEAFNSVAAVTEENTAATEELAAGTEQVTSAVRRIAGVAQENAAATEEVSSSVDSLTGSAASVAKSAHELEQIAQSLREQVARFRL
ncbi:MAG TPA: methyl-accepting chemotaxis protein [Symbiobacteriaceae bacterium]|nr:methyl-accepting chemotaxis protein [Symbiobacteriaceae bacterium]